MDKNIVQILPEELSLFFIIPALFIICTSFQSPFRKKKAYCNLNFFILSFEIISFRFHQVVDTFTTYIRLFNENEGLKIRSIHISSYANSKSNYLDVNFPIMSIF